MAATILHPTAELVGVHWIRAIPRINSDLVNTTLPAKSDDFAKHGFVQVTSVGGVPHAHNPKQRSVLQIDTWAYNKNSNRSPWGKANQLAEIIKAAMFDAGRRLMLPGDYNNALVHTVVVRTDARRIPGDPAFARYSMDIQVNWVEVNKEAS